LNRIDSPNRVQAERSIKRLLACAAVMFTDTAHAQAQAPDLRDRAFVEAVSAVVIFDHAFEACQTDKGFSAQDLASIKTWQESNGVEAIRARLVELARDQKNNRILEDNKAKTIKKMVEQKIDRCALAKEIVNSKSAQFATTAPTVLANLGVLKADTTNQTIPTTDVKPAAVPVDPNRAKTQAELLSQIDSFGFDSRATIGYAGAVILDIYPIVFFKNGDALTDIKGLAHPSGIAAHKKTKPDSWQQWRRNGSNLEITKTKGWSALSFNVNYPQLPSGFNLNGTYNSVGGFGNTMAWRQYKFSPDGQVARSNGAGSSDKVGDTSVVTSSARQNQLGQYRIDGITLQIKYDNGSAQSYILVTDPKSPSTIWLDGESYSKKK
jgi:hypothetical protein